MRALDAPFLEIGFYFADLTDADAFAKVACAILDRGSVALSARGWPGPSRRTTPFESIFDKPRDELTIQAEQLATALTDPNLRVIEVAFDQIIGISKAPELLGYFGVFSEEASRFDHHPICLMAEGNPFWGPNQAERAPAPGTRTYEVFRELVETLAPSYASLGLESPVECPTDLHRNPRSRAFMDFFMSAQFIGSADLVRIARLYDGAYQRPIGDGLYVSTYKYSNPEGISLDPNKASHLSVEVAKMVGQRRPVPA